jgi:hypothetical protein
MSADTTDPIVNLTAFIEDRLTALVPTIDLSAGSPAQTQFIGPLLAYLGTDPFDTDIQSFLLDRFAQEFPNIFAGDPSVINDVFVNPLIVMLEPFKREIQNIMLQQSLANPTTLSSDDADALAANWFETRNPGSYAGGVARVYYANPTNVTVETTTRFFTPVGLNYYPTNPQSITAETMVFNRDGSLYYVDVPVTAEATGAQYNIGINTLTGVAGLYGQVKVTNLADFEDGTSEIDTPTFIAQTQQSLTERSLVTRRGATAQLDLAYQGQVAAIQVIGANDVEMQRDILVATAPDPLWLFGQVSLYQGVAFVQCAVVNDSSTTPVPMAGDELFIYLDRYSYGGLWSAIPQSQRTVRLQVIDVIAGPMVSSSPYQLAYLVQYSDNNHQLPSNTPAVAVLSGGFSHVGTVNVTSIPDMGSVNITVANQTIHIYGHTDIYARPVLQTLQQTIITNLEDDNQWGKYATIQQTTLQTFSADPSNPNLVEDSTIDFFLAGVQPGDLLNILSGGDAGVYVIQRVVAAPSPGFPSQLWLTSNLQSGLNETSIRYQILDSIHLNWVEPKIPKLPFGIGAYATPSNDLNTTIGSTTFTFSNPSTDVTGYGAQIGDTVRILAGADKGDFTITALVSGQSVIVDRAAGATESELQYQIFTSEQALTLPLVRITEISILDSSKQTTGVDIPYGKPVAIIPVSTFNTALVRGISQANSGYVLPVWNNPNDPSDPFIANRVNATGSPGPTSIQSYSLGFEPSAAGDIWKSLLSANSNQAEFNFTVDMLTGPCSYFLATSEDLSQLDNFPPIDPNPGDALTLKNGPNAGSYLIQNVIKSSYFQADGSVVWLYLIKIYGTFPVDTFRELIEFIDTHGQTVPKLNGTTPVPFPSFFQTTYQGLGSQLDLALRSTGAASPGAAILQAAIQNVTQVAYEWGNPARGTLRSFFLQPALFQENTALSLNPTLFNFQLPNGNDIQFRPDPSVYQQYQVVPARLNSDTSPVDYPRDLVASTGANVYFSSTTRSTMFQVGVLPGDVLQVNEEVFMLGSTGLAGANTDHQLAVSTTASSTIITALPSATYLSNAPFHTGMVGDLVFIDQGADEGGYTIVSIVNPDVNGYSFQAMLDRPLTTSTPTVVLSGSSGQILYSGSVNQVLVNGVYSLTSFINNFITIYGADSQYQGSYKITAAAQYPALPAIPTGTLFTIDRGAATGNFPSESGEYWAITAAPTTPPDANSSGMGTLLTGLQPIRVYNEVTENFPIVYVNTLQGTLPYTSYVTVSPSPNGQSWPILGVSQPFVITRPNVRRITPSEMSDNTQGFLYYFDTTVVSLGPESAFNLPVDTSYLTLVEGTYECGGYRMLVDDFTLTFSMKETGAIQFPNSILPVGSTDSLDNFLVLFGVPILITYDQAPIVQQIQNYLDSADDRVTSANLLARHFLPTYVSYDATYSGGEAPSVVAQDIAAYINSLAIETPMEVSQLEKIIDDDGGDPVVPTTVSTTLHDWDRDIWVEFSQTKLGGTATNVPYNGSPRVSYLIPGPDESGVTPLPVGERINLTQT